MTAMKIAWGAAAAVSLSVAAMIGSGVASAGSAPSVVGQKYSAAKSTLSGAGYKPIVSTTVGDQYQWPDCVVTNQVARTVQPPSNSGGSATNEILLSLNCEASFATAGTPGMSLGSPQGSQAAAAATASAASAAAASSAAAAQQQDESLAGSNSDSGGDHH
jgi:hypothetical protein